MAKELGKVDCHRQKILVTLVSHEGAFAVSGVHCLKRFERKTFRRLTHVTAAEIIRTYILQ